ncbi:MAG: hypothetical protein IPN82_10795 [Chitinophagaceae bacterium]|nr:hypothetical protein [Chitinophagaceae bacterium]
MSVADELPPYVPVKGCGLSSLWISPFKKKNNLFLIIGPPTLKPVVLLEKLGSLVAAALSPAGFLPERFSFL